MSQIDEDLLLVLDSSGIGSGEPDLGETLMKAFLTQLLESGRLPARIICMNSGIFLTTSGSAVLDLLRGFAAAGSEIQSCGTCLNYYKKQDDLQIGMASNMKETVKAMLRFGKVLQP